MDAAARIAALEAQNAELLEQNEYLKAALGMEIEPSILLGLTPHEAAVFGILLKRDRVTKDQIMHALYATRPDQEEPDIKIVDVYVCKLRAKLKRYGIAIKTIWGAGYSIDAENKALADRFIVQKGGAA